MRSLIALNIILLFLTAHGLPSLAGDFKTHMQLWNEKRILASQYLLEAEKDLKDGDKTKGCINQRKASKYGIEATQSLMEAIRINGTTQGLEGVESQQRRWEALEIICN